MDTKIQRREVPRKRYSAAHLALSNARAARVPRNRYNTARLALSDTLAPRLTCNIMAAPVHRKDQSLTTYPSGSLSSDASDVSDDNGKEPYEDARPPPDTLHPTTYEDARPIPDDLHRRSISAASAQHQRSAASAQHSQQRSAGITHDPHGGRNQIYKAWIAFSKTSAVRVCFKELNWYTTSTQAQVSSSNFRKRCG